MNKIGNEIAILNDYYGSLLTKLQSDTVRLYYDRDMSMCEIASEQGITRMAVKMSLDNAAKKLRNYEDKLSLCKLSGSILRELYDLRDKPHEIDEMRIKLDKIIALVEEL
ncbi:MAG: DNA-binding protein [Christensenellaceae bacterium]|jgi:predicted DNA-binding protein YlxM (UPF0122 family)|nr:DNA-binding protein [Christensenellaceae bacterium]